MASLHKVAVRSRSQYSNYWANWSIPGPLIWNVLHGIYIELFNNKKKKTEVEQELGFFLAPKNNKQSAELA